MPTITIHRPHKLSHTKLVAIANKIAAELEDEYGITSAWSGNDTVKVRGTGVTGELHLAPDTIKLDIKLGLMMALFGDKIREGVEAKLDKLLTAKPAKKK